MFVSCDSQQAAEDEAEQAERADRMQHPNTNPGSKKMLNPMIDEDTEDEEIPSPMQSPAAPAPEPAPMAAPAPAPDAFGAAAGGFAPSDAPGSSGSNSTTPTASTASSVGAGTGSMTFGEDIGNSNAHRGPTTSEIDMLKLCVVVACAGAAVRRESKIDADLLEIPKEELDLDKKIGRGSFGEVYKCHWRGTTIAVKVLTDQAMNSDTLAEFRTGELANPHLITDRAQGSTVSQSTHLRSVVLGVVAEVNMMNKVRHPNVVLLMGICSTPPHLSIITCAQRPSPPPSAHKHTRICCKR